MQLLFLTSRLPFPPDRGDRLRTFNLLANLGKHHEITLLTFVSNEEEEGMVTELEGFCKEIYAVRRPKLRSIATVTGNMWRSTSLQLLYYRSRKMQHLVDRLLSRNAYDAAYIHLFRMAPYLENRPSIYRIADLTDMISSEILASLPFRSPASRVLYSIERRRIAACERTVADWAEETWLISDRDKLMLAESSPNANLQTVPNGVDLSRFFPTEQNTKNMRLIFVGHMDVFHNIDAVSYLVNEIMPRVRKKIPETILDIVGSGKTPDSIGSDRKQGVRFKGFVPDLNQALNEASVFVAPLRFSAGVQNKVLEAMAAGVPVVTTRNVNEGLDSIEGQDIWVGDNADELAAKIVLLLEDETTCLGLGQAGRRFVEKRFSWQVAVERLDQIEQSLLHRQDKAI